jgi:hypothetical protein
MKGLTKLYFLAALGSCASDFFAASAVALALLSEATGAPSAVIDGFF